MRWGTRWQVVDYYFTVVLGGDAFDYSGVCDYDAADLWGVSAEYDCLVAEAGVDYLAAYCYG